MGWLQTGHFRKEQERDRSITIIASWLCLWHEKSIICKARDELEEERMLHSANVNQFSWLLQIRLIYPFLDIILILLVLLDPSLTRMMHTHYLKGKPLVDGVGSLYKLTTSIIRILHFTCVKAGVFCSRKKAAQFSSRGKQHSNLPGEEPFSFSRWHTLYTRKKYGLLMVCPLELNFLPLFHLGALSFLRNDYGGNFLLFWTYICWFEEKKVLESISSVLLVDYPCTQLSRSKSGES